MKLRYIALGCTVFTTSAIIAEVLSRLAETNSFLGRPMLYFVILGAGILIGCGVTKR